MFRGALFYLCCPPAFSALYYYATLLKPLGGKQSFDWRMLLMRPYVTAFLVVSGKWQHVLSLWDRAKRKPHLLGMLCVSSVLLDTLQWLALKRARLPA